MNPAIEGSEHLTASRLLDEIPRGGRFTTYTTCISIVVGTDRRPTRIQYLAPRDSHLASGFRHVWPTILMGWWGLPWGPIHTIESILNYLHGGTDLTEAVLTHAEHMFQDGFGTPEELANLKRLGKQMGIRRA
jgi:hypothetical protein